MQNRQVTITNKISATPTRILHSLAIVAQRLWRGAICWVQNLVRRRCIFISQALLRCWQKRKEYRKRLAASQKIQAIMGRWLVVISTQQKRLGVIAVQKRWRGALCRMMMLRSLQAAWSQWEAIQAHSKPDMYHKNFYHTVRVNLYSQHNTAMAQETHKRQHPHAMVPDDSILNHAANDSFTSRHETIIAAEIHQERHFNDMALEDDSTSINDNDNNNKNKYNKLNIK